MASKRTCPECHLTFEAELPQTGMLVCPLCNSVCSPHPPAGRAPMRTPPPRGTSGRHVLRGVVAVGVVLSLVGGIGYAYFLLEGIGRKTPAEVPSVTSAPIDPEPPQPDEVIPIVPAKPDEVIPIVPAPAWIPEVIRKFTTVSPQIEPKEQPIIPPKVERPPLTLPERIQQAIDRGIAYLLAHHGEHNQYRNYLGLLGLTLLECGTAADHAAVRQIAALIRSHESDITQTYELTLAILFLDRLGESSDRALIRSFGQRLLWGQLECGAWTYSCLMHNRKRLPAKRPDGMPIIPPLPRGPNTVPIRGMGGRPRITYRGDNSNTQFAILGLWVAQRQDVPARSALLATEQYFRATQAADGSWMYHPTMRLYRDSNTCAGLMSLAMRHGVVGGQGRDIRPQEPIPVRDAAVTRGLNYLAQALDKIKVVGGNIIGIEARDPLYFLWSLERMAVIYDLKKIGTREWYPWAAEMLVQAQRQDGRWDGGGPVGTCFALLILRRSNFAKDLQLAVKDPPARPLSEAVGPAILQGRDAILRQVGKPPDAAVLPGKAVSPRPSPSPGPTFTRVPNTKK